MRRAGGRGGGRRPSRAASGERGRGCDTPRRSPGLRRGPIAARAGGARPGRGSGMAGAPAALLRPALLVLLLASGRPALAGRAVAGAGRHLRPRGRGGPAAAPAPALLGGWSDLWPVFPRKQQPDGEWPYPGPVGRRGPRARASCRRSPLAGSGSGAGGRAGGAQVVGRRAFCEGVVSSCRRVKAELPARMRARLVPASPPTAETLGLDMASLPNKNLDALQAT